MTLTKESVQSFIEEYHKAFEACKEAKDWKGFFAKYHKGDLEFIRPSGNPLTNEEWLAIMSSGGTEYNQNKFVETHFIKIIGNGNVAVAYFTSDQIFTFKGTPNEDKAKTTFVLEEVGGGIKLAHGHRCTGVPISK